MNRVFMLSPANCNGERAQWLLRKSACSELALRLRSSDGAPLGEVFSFLSALYFRGKLAYARAFARPPAHAPGVLIITPSAGLVGEKTKIRLTKLRGFSRVPISKNNSLYRRLLIRDARKLVAQVGPRCDIILLGSIATAKYIDILTRVVGEQLRVPAEFVGRGDMSRGALLLRCVRERRELEYIPAAGRFESAGKRLQIKLRHDSVPATGEAPRGGQGLVPQMKSDKEERHGNSLSDSF